MMNQYLNKYSMHTKDIFEQTMLSCGYVIDKIIQNEDSQDVRKVEGRVKIPKKVTISGNRQTIIEEKKFLCDLTPGKEDMIFLYRQLWSLIS